MKIRFHESEELIFILFIMLSIGMNVFAYTFSVLYKAIIVFVVLAWISLKKKIKVETYHMSLLFFIGWCSLSLVWNRHEVDMKLFPTFIYCFATTVLLHQFLDRESRFYMLMKCIVISAYALAFVMIAHFGLMAMIASRVGNEVVNTNRAGTIFAVALFFCLYLFYVEKNKLYLAAGLPLAFFVVLSGSKTALIILGLSVFVMVSLKDGAGSQRMLKNMMIGTIFMFLGLLLIVRIPFFYHLIGARFLEFVEVMSGRRQVLVGEHSIYMRMTLIQYGLRGILEKPVIGHGLGSYLYYSPWPGRYSHANYIELWFNLGVVGLVLFYWPCFTLIKYFRKAKRWLDRYARAFLLAYLSFYALYGIMGIFFNELFEWVLAEMMCSFVLMKYRTHERACNRVRHIECAQYKTYRQ